jgi:membrane-associated protease RseP (regulator of RpoE activity)
MTEEGPLEPVAPEPETPTEPHAAAEPTQPVPATDPATAAAPAPPTWPGAATPQAPAPPVRSSTVAVPKWLILVLGALAVGLLGFAVGWIAAPGRESRTVVVGPGSRFGPGGGGFFGNPGDGKGSSAAPAPSVPRAPRPGGAFLGVGSARSTDPAGARIVTVVPGSPAAGAGLAAGDVVTKVGGDAVQGPAQLAKLIAAHRAGDDVTITYVRGGKTDTATARLVARSSVEIPTPSTTNPGL